MGVLAVKLDCKELLIVSIIRKLNSSLISIFKLINLIISNFFFQATTICALISLIFTALFLIITVIGIFIAACQDCRESIKILFVGIFIIAWILASSILNVFLVIKAWPFAFGDDALDEIKEKMNTWTHQLKLSASIPNWPFFHQPNSKSLFSASSC